MVLLRRPRSCAITSYAWVYYVKRGRGSLINGRPIQEKNNGLGINSLTVQIAVMYIQHKTHTHKKSQTETIQKLKQ